MNTAVRSSVSVRYRPKWPIDAATGVDYSYVTVFIGNNNPRGKSKGSVFGRHQVMFIVKLTKIGRDYDLIEGVNDQGRGRWFRSSNV